MRIEQALGHAILWVACRHHVLELFLGSVWKTVSPYPSKSPIDPLSQRVVSEVFEKGMPVELDSSCPQIFKAESAFFKARKEELIKLQGMLTREGDKAAVPRQDYAYMWDLIQVQSFHFSLDSYLSVNTLFFL